MKGTFDISFSKQSLNEFTAACNVAIRNIGRGTKKATIAACEEILADSLLQVPLDTFTLRSSGYYEVYRRGDTAATTWAYEGVVGYGGNGDPVNPKSGKRASSYMVAVHENLNAKHPSGKAKYLEDPVREYAKERFRRTVFKYARESLADMSK